MLKKIIIIISDYYINKIYMLNFCENVRFGYYYIHQQSTLHMQRVLYDVPGNLDNYIVSCT